MANAKAKANPRRRRKTSRRKRRNTAAITAKRNTAPKRSYAPKRRNPAARVENRRKRRSRRRNPFRTKNPGDVKVIPLLITATAIVATEFVAARFLGPQSGVKGALVKGAIGYGLAAKGKRLPLVGKHAESIGAGLMLLAAVDIARMYVWPQLQPLVNQLPFFGQQQMAAGNGVSGLVDFNPAAVGMSGLVNYPLQ